MKIAIDGPAGSGKSTIARLVARSLGFSYLDTGAMYRALTVRALEEGIEVTNDDALFALARKEPICFDAFGSGSVSIGDEDVTRAIRTAQVDAAVSPVSACPRVREALTDRQREIAQTQDIVMEGRDIGTVVFPDAEVKIFLTATPQARARRRSLQNIQRGIGETNEEKLLQALLKRDEYDSSREVAPLRAADDAVELDTSDMSIDEVAVFVCNLARSRMGAATHVEAGGQESEETGSAEDGVAVVQADAASAPAKPQVGAAGNTQAAHK